MKLGLTEKQYKNIISKLLEQSEAEPVSSQPETGTSSAQAGGKGYPQVGKWESGVTRGPGNQVGVTKWSDVVGSKLTRSKGNQLKEQNDLAFDRRYGTASAAEKSNRENRELVNTILGIDPHTRNTILGIAALFIPVVGVALSSGILAYDAKQYYDEGDSKSAGLMLMFALLPGVGKIISKIPGISKLGTKGMVSLASKVKIGSKSLTQTEVEVLNGISKNRQLIQFEMENSAKKITINAARNQAQNKVVKNNIIKKVINTGKSVLGYTAAGLAYDTTYDAIERNKEEENLRKLNDKLGIIKKEKK